MQTPNHRWLLVCRLIIQTSLRVHYGSCKFVLVSLAGGAVAFHQYYVGHFGVLEEHSQNACAVSAML